MRGMGGMAGLGGLMKQAQQMQDRMKKAQEEKGGCMPVNGVNKADHVGAVKLSLASIGGEKSICAEQSGAVKLSLQSIDNMTTGK